MPHIRTRLLSSAVCGILCLAPTFARAADTLVAAGTVESETVNSGGADSLTVEEGASLSVDGTALKWNSGSTGIVITNSGTIESTAGGGRAINAGGSDTAPVARPRKTKEGPPGHRRATLPTWVSGRMFGPGDPSLP